MLNILPPSNVGGIRLVRLSCEVRSLLPACGNARGHEAKQLLTVSKLVEKENGRNEDVMMDYCGLGAWNAAIMASGKMYINYAQFYLRNG